MGNLTHTAHGGKRFWFRAARSYQLYLLLLPTIVYAIIFLYVPMYGVIIAFKDFSPYDGILGSKWVDLKNFDRFFHSAMFWSLIKNTLSVTVYSLLAGFPIPIIFAVCLNYTTSPKYKKVVQTVTYAPHFISTVVLVGMLNVFLSTNFGIVNRLLTILGYEPIRFLTDPKLFRHLYVISGIWQNTGWGTIIYLSALSGVDPMIHEAAIVDGANKFKRIWYVDIPSILPTIVILLILRFGNLMGLGFEKVYLMQNSLNIANSEVIATYVYKVGLINADFSFSAAVSLFNNVLNLILLIVFNQISKKLGQTRLF